MSNIDSLLLNAVHVLPPYPWAAHVDFVLRLFHGPMLAERMALAQQLTQATYADGRPGLGIDRIYTRQLDLQMRPGRKFFAYAQYGTPFALPYGLLLPMQTTDQFHLRPGDAGEGPDLYRGDENTLASSRHWPGYVHLLEWVLGLQELLTDIVETHQMVTEVVHATDRRYSEVLWAVYPSFKVVFDAGKEIRKRPPLGQRTLQQFIHPDDQEMIRNLLDMCAAGRMLDRTQRTLVNLTASYEPSFGD